MVQTHKIKPVLVRILCVLALVLLSFSHKPFEVKASFSQITTINGTASEPVFIRYETMPDGSVVSICISENSPDSHNHHNSHNVMMNCEACRISASFALPVPPATSRPDINRNESARIVSIASELPRSRPYPPSAPPHAPPALA